MSGLPKGWIEAPISDLVELQENGKPFQQGWSPQCESRTADADEWAVVKTTAIQPGEFWEHENKALPATLEPRPQIEITAGDVLMTCAGPRNRCGVACLVRSTRGRLMMSGKMYRFRPRPDLLDPQFLSRFIGLHRTQVRIDEMKTGINDSGLNLTHSRFGKLQVVLPPLNEQRRIVERIEALFAEIDKGVESLRAARTALGLYRQSLLKSAFDGRLTADWRAANPDKLETPDALLARIKSEREARYEAAIAEWKAACAAWEKGRRKGKKPAKPKKPAPVDFAVGSDAQDTQLPTGWGLFRVSALCDVVRGGSPRPAGDKRFYEGAIPFLKVADLTRTDGKILRSHAHTIKEAGLAKTRYVDLQTLMISNSGATLGVPKVCAFPTTFNDGIAAFLGLSEAEQFFHYWFWVRMTASLRALNQGAAQPNLNTDVLGGTLIPQCSPAEEAEIVCILDERLSAADALGEEIEAGLKRADALRQSILTEAFAGRLVPQDPNDEPAAVLLERILAEREVKPKAKRWRRNKKSEQTEELAL